MMKRHMWLMTASFILWLFAFPAQASSMGDLVKHGDVAGVASALDKGAAVNEVDGVTALYIACEAGNVEIAKLLIDRGADVSLPVTWQRTPLYAANKGGHAQIVKLLLDHGANPNQLAKSQTPLHVAAENGCLQCVIHLVEAGGNVNALTSNGNPPIHLAKLGGHEDVVAYLRSHGRVDRPLRLFRQDLHRQALNLAKKFSTVRAAPAIFRRRVSKFPNG